jgi:hypothetical protein
MGSNHIADARARPVRPSSMSRPPAMGARPRRRAWAHRGTCFVLLSGWLSRVHVAHLSCATGRWRGAMHRRLTCLATVARARHQRLAICSSAPKARRDCMSLARGGRRHVSMAARFGCGASGAADARLRHALLRSHPVLLGSLLSEASPCSAHIASEFQKSASKERPLDLPAGSTHSAHRAPTVSSQLAVRVSSSPSGCLAPSEPGREGIQFAAITTTTAYGLQRFSIEARRPRLRSWSAPSSGPCRRVLSRSLGQQPPCCPYSPTTPLYFAPHNVHDGQLWLQMLHGRLNSTVAITDAAFTLNRFILP